MTTVMDHQIAALGHGKTRQIGGVWKFDGRVPTSAGTSWVAGGENNLHRRVS